MAQDSTPSAQPPRADLVLTVAIGLVCVIVLALIVVLALGSRAYEQALAERANVRASRNEAIAFAASEANAATSQRNYLISRDRADLDSYRAAQADARSRFAAMRRSNAGDTDALALIDTIEALTEREFAALDAGLDNRRSGPFVQRGELEDTVDALHASIIRRADRSRVSEEAARARTNNLAAALAVLSLFVSGLALLALRRERGQWALATEAAEAARERAAASDLAKTRFLAAASHDMRQPLHALTLYLSALERRVENPEAREIISKMERATQSMVGMFSTLLDLARIQAGVVHPEIEDVVLQDVIDRIVAENPGGSVAATKTRLGVRTDPVLLERVLRNLVTNALRHGGGAARIEVKADDDHVAIAVADNGPGIAEDDQERIFDEFVRVDSRAGGEGLGLGLAIVKRICDMLEIPIRVESAPDEGARFELSAPRVAVPAVTKARALDTDALRGVPVLVVDDDSLAREAIAGAVRDAGAVVRDAGNQAEAEEVLASGFAPRLILMDLRIDGALRGVDIAAALCARLAAPPRVIVITGDTGPEAIEVLRASGHKWLIKPVDPQELSEAAAAELEAANA